MVLGMSFSVFDRVATVIISDIIMIYILHNYDVMHDHVIQIIMKD